jgi:hypothetical protein
MAIKAPRSFMDGKVSQKYFVTTTGTMGQIVFAGTGTAPVGINLDDPNARVEVIATVSGRTPIGILLADVVNIDQSRYYLNKNRSEVQVNSKVALLTDGEIVLNNLGAGAAPATGVVYPTTAYAGPNGTLFHQAGFAGSGYPVVGKFLSGRDVDGYAEVSIGLRN